MKKRMMPIMMAVVLILFSNLTIVATAFAQNEIITMDATIENRLISVSLGDSRSTAITENGDLYCWGQNNYGQVGDGTTVNKDRPTKMLNNVTSVSLGIYHSAAVAENGDLYCWGYGSDGQMGNGTYNTRQSTPVKVLENVTSVSLGGFHSAAITENGDLYCWGQNNYGQVGDGTTNRQGKPVKVLENVVLVSLSVHYSAAITENGDLYCWGSNTSGQVGDGTTTNHSTPVKILESVASVSLGDSHSAAITKNGDLYCWGSNSFGQVGDGTTTNHSTPVKILESVASVSLGDSHSAAITKNGDLYCWGSNSFGQVGDGKTTNHSTPVKILENVASVWLDDSLSTAVAKNGDLYCWGSNYYGQIGNKTTNQKTPTKILENVRSVSLGDSHSAAITENGDLYCWGSNYYGQIGNGTNTKQNTPIKVSINTISENVENKLQCSSSCIVKVGCNKILPVTAFEDSLDKLKSLTNNVTWKSEDTNVATVDNIGFILPTNATKYSSENGTYQTWRSTGMLSVHGISEGTTTITGTAADGSKVSFQVTVTEPEIIQGSNTEGNGGSLVLGEESSGSGNSSAAEFFPANWSLKSSVFPVEISKSEGENGSYTLRGTVGIGKGDWLDDDATWSKYKKNVSDANKYTGRVDCLNSYKDTWGVKSVTAVTTDKFEALPKLSVMGYFENTYDKNGNLVSATGKLAADAKWSGSISWQFVTPIGPLYLNLSGSGKLSGTLEPQYDYDNKSLKVASGSLKLTPSVSLEGGYGIDKVATIGAQGTLSVPITLVPASKGEFEAKAAIHVKLVFVIDWTHDLAAINPPIVLWDTTNKTRNIKNSNVVQYSGRKLSEGIFSEMDTSFDAFAGDWNPNEDTGKLRESNRSISETVTDSITMLQGGILPSSLPIQAQIGRKNVMVFQAYDNTRTTLNSTVLKYSVLENGVWSEPKAILDDGCADMYADMKVVDGRLALVWQKEKKIIAGNVETDSERVLKDIAENSEIYFALFDEGTNAFLNPVKVTDNNYYDMMPRIVNADNEVTVSWVRNDEADLMQETGSNAIYTAKWNGTSFSEEISLSKASGTIDDYIVYKDENGIQSVFTGQANGIAAMFNTNGDVIDGLSELMLSSGDGKISSLNYINGKVSFISKGTLYTYDTSSGTLSSAQAGESAFGSETQYCSNGEKAGYIWSIYDEESNMGKILASMKTEDGYSEPVTICEKEDTMWRYFSPIINEDGNWEIVINALDTETNNNSLLYVTKKAEKRLELAGASINENDILDGLTGIDYFVTNTQDTTINSIEIEITLKDGSKITKTVPVTLLPGESNAGTAYMDIKDVDSTQNVTLSVTAENQEDKSGCVVTEQIGHADISVEAVSSETKDNVEITAMLKNNSSVNASAVLHLYGNENKTLEIKKQEGISIRANGTAQAKFTLKKKDIAYNKNRAAYLTLVAQTGNGDYNEDNNTAYIILYQQEDSPTPPSDNPGDQTKPIKIGHAVTANRMNYRVTKVNADGTGEVAMTGTSRKKTEKNFTSLKVGDSITINGKSFKITTIGKNAFNGFAKLKTVTIGKNISSIGDKAFYKCAALTKTSIPSKVTKIGSQAFNNCKRLKTVSIGKNVSAIGDKAFYKCTALTKITIPVKVSKIGKQAFSGCKKLKNITIKTKKLTSKKVGSNAFKGIYGKATIKVPKEKFKVYKKLLKAKGVSSKAKIKK